MPRTEVADCSAVCLIYEAIPNYNKRPHERSIVSDPMELSYYEEDAELSSMFDELASGRSVVDEGTPHPVPQGNDFPLGGADLPLLDRAADFTNRLQVIAERNEVHSLVLALARAEDEERMGSPSRNFVQ